MAYKLPHVPIPRPNRILIDPAVQAIRPRDLELTLTDNTGLVTFNLVLDGNLEFLLPELCAIFVDPLLRLGIGTCAEGSRGLAGLRVWSVRLWEIS